MNYYYDLNLSFSEFNYKFYELEENDYFDYLKKIPLFKISSRKLKEIMFNNIKVSKDFLDIIYNKSITKNNRLEYACIFTDKNNCIALEFDKDGNSITRSPLTIEDELNILEINYTLKNYDLKYELISKNNYEKILRKEKTIKNMITLEINKLYKEKNIDKLKFLYLEWFGFLKNDINDIKKDMLNELNNKIDLNTEKVLDIIKMSYNNV